MRLLGRCRNGLVRVWEFCGMIVGIVALALGNGFKATAGPFDGEESR